MSESSESKLSCGLPFGEDDIRGEITDEFMMDVRMRNSGKEYFGGVIFQLIHTYVYIYIHIYI